MRKPFPAIGILGLAKNESFQGHQIKIRTSSAITTLQRCKVMTKKYQENKMSSFGKFINNQNFITILGHIQTYEYCQLFGYQIRSIIRIKFV